MLIVLWILGLKDSLIVELGVVRVSKKNSILMYCKYKIVVHISWMIVYNSFILLVY